MRTIMKSSLVLLIILLAISCQSNSEADISTESFDYKQQHWERTSVSRSFKSISYKATEVPLAYYLLKNASGENIDSLLRARKEERVIEFDFSQLDRKDLLDKRFTHRDYKESVSYMAFTIKKDFSIITINNDTINCSGVLFERNYKLAPFKRLLLYFDGVPVDSGIKLLYDDQLFGNGLMKFNLSMSKIET